MRPHLGGLHGGAGRWRVTVVATGGGPSVGSGVGTGVGAGEGGAGGGEVGVELGSGVAGRGLGGSGATLGWLATASTFPSS